MSSLIQQHVNFDIPNSVLSSYIYLSNSKCSLFVSEKWSR